jgi:hypothetical protein
MPSKRDAKPGGGAFTGRLKHFTAPPVTGFTWVPPLGALGGAVVALRAVDLPCLVEGLGAHFRVPVLSAVEVSQEKGDRTPCEFLHACCFRCRHHPVPHLWPCLSRKPDTSGGTPSSRVIMIAPEIFFFPERFPIQTPFAKAFRYTNHMEKLTKGRIVAS